MTKPRTPSELVSRFRLVDLLLQGMQRKLTLISAPAGYGKTTLIAEWAHRCPVPVAWLSLEEEDDEIRRFFSYIVAALANAGIPLRKELIDAAYFPEQPSIDDLLMQVINEVSLAEMDMALVIDDYQFISETGIHRFLSFLIKHQPKNLHIILSTRKDPPFPLGRLQGHGDVTEIRANLLRFSDMEAFDYFSNFKGPGVSTQQVSTLVSQADGWIAGLQIASIRIRATGSLEIEAGGINSSDRNIRAYIIEEILDKQKPDVRNFLMASSLFNRFNPRMCAAVTGITNSDHIISEIEDNSLFLVCLDEEGVWYRYHHLFGHAIEQHVRDRHPEFRQKCITKAIQWLQDNGYELEAIDCAAMAEDSHTYIGLMNSHIEQVWNSGRQALLIEWLDSLSTEEIIEWPRLCVYHAFALILVGNASRAEQRLAHIDQRQSGSPVDDSELLGFTAAVKAWIAAYRGDIAALREHALTAAALLPATAADLKCSLEINLGDADTLDGNMREADAHFSSAYSLSEEAGNLYYLLLAASKWSFVLWCMGAIHTSIELCKRVLQLAAASGLTNANVVGYLSGHYAAALTEIGDLDQAELCARKAISSCDQRRVTLLGWRYIFLLRALVSRGDIEAAQRHLTEFEDLSVGESVPYWLARRVLAIKARLLTMYGKADQAVELLHEAGVAGSSEPSFLEEESNIALCGSLLSLNRNAPASKLLQKMLESANAGSRLRNLVEILLLRSIALERGGDTQGAENSLWEAVVIAEPRGMVQLFRDYANEITTALGRLSVIHSENEFIANGLLSARSHRAQRVALDDHDNVEELSSREIEVLELISVGLSNKEIAETLFISLATVKWHTSNIYGKLGVSSRTHAVSIARGIGLIPG